MISKNLQDAINEQINRELSSEYQYLSMAAYFISKDLDGMGNYFHVQSQEERLHAMKLYNFLLDRNGKVVLKQINAPKTDFKDIPEVFQIAYEQEQFISKCINDLVNTAISEGDHALISFLKWYVDEQVEEESSAHKLVNRINLIKGEGHGLLMIDSELAQRRFTGPIENTNP